MSLTVVNLTANSTILLLKFTGLTDGGEDAREAEVVHSVEGEQVEQKLLPFFLAEQECMRFIQLPVGGREESRKSQSKSRDEIRKY